VTRQLKAWCARHRQLLTYGVISVLATLIDVVVSYSTEQLLIVTKAFPAEVQFLRWAFKGATVGATTANTVGVLVGFVTQFVLSSKRVFRSRSRRTFVIYLLTFGFGLVLQDGIVALSRALLFGSSSQFIPFLVSKGLSIVLPFFVLYYIRRALIQPEPDHQEAPCPDFL
jgi:putative flippase GtrA